MGVRAPSVIIVSSCRSVFGVSMCGCAGTVCDHFAILNPAPATVMNSNKQLV